MTTPARFLEPTSDTHEDRIFSRALNAGLTVNELATIYGMSVEDITAWAREVLG